MRAWKRVLYEKQPYKDNYIDPDKFLDHLHLVTYSPSNQVSFRTVFVSASVVVQQFTVVVSFLMIYKFILRDQSVKVISILDFLLLILGYGVHNCFDSNNLAHKHTFFSVILFLVCLRMVAPVLKELTLSFSSDTIHALAISLSAIHLAFHDYSFVNGEREEYSGTLSLNAAIFTAIILASRLGSIELVLAFILLAIICFSFFPRTARLVKSKSLALHLILTTIIWFITSLSLYFLDKTLFFVFEILILLLWFVGPLCYLHMLVFKRAMKGPWDIASVE